MSTRPTVRRDEAKSNRRSQHANDVHRTRSALFADVCHQVSEKTTWVRLLSLGLTGSMHGWATSDCHQNFTGVHTFERATPTDIQDIIGVSGVPHHNIRLFNYNDSTSKTRVLKVAIRLNGGQPGPTFQT